MGVKNLLLPSPLGLPHHFYRAVITCDACGAPLRSGRHDLYVTLHDGDNPEPAYDGKVFFAHGGGA